MSAERDSATAADDRAHARAAGSGISRADVEDFLYHEAALLDAWSLDEWLTLLTGDVTYRVPSPEARGRPPTESLYLIADDAARLRGRVARLLDPHAHAEFPHSHTRRLITNVRIVEQSQDRIAVEANFAVHRFRRDEDVRVYVGRYRYALRTTTQGLRIAAREALLDAHELGTLGAISFIL